MPEDKDANGFREVETLLFLEDQAEVVTKGHKEDFPASSPKALASPNHTSTKVQVTTPSRYEICEHWEQKH